MYGVERGVPYAALAGILADAVRDEPDAVQEIGLGPLSVEAVRRLAGPARDARNLPRRTGGNPLFLVKLLRDWEEGPEGGPEDCPGKPGSLRVVVEERLRRLSEEEARILLLHVQPGEARFPPTQPGGAGDRSRT